MSYTLYDNHATWTNPKTPLSYISFNFSSLASLRYFWTISFVHWYWTKTQFWNVQKYTFRFSYKLPKFHNFLVFIILVGNLCNYHIKTILSKGPIRRLNLFSNHTVWQVNSEQVCRIFYLYWLCKFETVFLPAPILNILICFLNSHRTIL